MSDPLFEVTVALPARSVVDNDECRTFRVGEHVLASDEPAEAHGEMIVHVKQAQPPAENVPWLRYYVSQAVFSNSTKRFVPTGGVVAHQALPRRRAR
jgi:hypothetical protein